MNNKLYIGNLSYNVSEESLKELFANYGTIESINLITDRMTGRKKGFGFIEFSSSSEASEAMNNLDNQELDGRPLKVTIAKPQENRGDRGSRGGSGRGGFGGSGGNGGNGGRRGRYR